MSSCGDSRADSSFGGSDEARRRRRSKRKKATAATKANPPPTPTPTPIPIVAPCERPDELFEPPDSLPLSDVPAVSLDDSSVGASAWDPVADALVLVLSLSLVPVLVLVVDGATPMVVMVLAGPDQRQQFIRQFHDPCNNIIRTHPRISIRASAFRSLSSVC